MTANNGFSAIGKALGVSESIDDARKALSSTEMRWLLVLDNADDPNFDYGTYIPSGNRGAVIITSRIPECQQYNTHGWEGFESLDINDATQLLLKAAKVPEESMKTCQEDARIIADLLGSHTLALIQAGSFVSKGYCTLDQYPAKYEKHRKRVLEHYSKQERSRYRHVYATFEASASILQDHEDEAGKDALDLLALLATLHWSLLPLRIFEHLWKDLESRLQSMVEDPTQVGLPSKWHLYRLPEFLGRERKTGMTTG